MTEAVTWNRMANDGYRLRFYNDIIWIYEYRGDGLTKTGFRLFLNNPNGYGLIMREKAAFLGWSRIQTLRMWYTFACDLSQRYSAREIAAFIDAPHVVMKSLLVLHDLIRIIKTVRTKLRK